MTFDFDTLATFAIMISLVIPALTAARSAYRAFTGNRLILTIDGRRYVFDVSDFETVSVVKEIDAASQAVSKKIEAARAAELEAA